MYVCKFQGNFQSSCKNGVLKNFTKLTGKHLCQSLFKQSCRPETLSFIKKETLAQVFSCEFCEVSKNNFLITLLWCLLLLLPNWQNYFSMSRVPSDYGHIGGCYYWERDCFPSTLHRQILYHYQQKFLKGK